VSLRERKRERDLLYPGNTYVQHPPISLSRQFAHSAEEFSYCLLQGHAKLPAIMCDASRVRKAKQSDRPLKRPPHHDCGELCDSRQARGHERIRLKKKKSPWRTPWNSEKATKTNLICFAREPM
jgi:hypothetical protein